jgi:predicted secreted protein
MKEILIVSHCILNNASKVLQDESELADEYRQRDELLKAALEKGVQLFQLPCPEFIIYGPKRWGHVKDQFDNTFFRGECRRMLGPVMDQLKDYAAVPERFRIIGIVSVEGSPSCGCRLTCRADWGGELCLWDSGQTDKEVRMTEEPGVYMEEIMKMLGEYGLDIPVMTIPEATAAI